MRDIGLLDGGCYVNDPYSTYAGCASTRPRPGTPPTSCGGSRATTMSSPSRSARTCSCRPDARMSEREHDRRPNARGLEPRCHRALARSRRVGRGARSLTKWKCPTGCRSPACWGGVPTGARCSCARRTPGVMTRRWQSVPEWWRPSSSTSPARVGPERGATAPKRCDKGSPPPTAGAIFEYGMEVVRPAVGAGPERSHLARSRNWSEARARHRNRPEPATAGRIVLVHTPSSSELR